MKNILTKEKIINITKKQGYFDVSLKWRYAWLQKIISDLIDQNILIREKRIGKSIRFVLR